MGLPNRIEGDVYIDGALTARSMSLSPNSVGDAQVQAGSAGNYVQAEKCRRQPRIRYNQANVTVVSETRPIYVAYGATGTLLRVLAGSIVAAIGAATVTVDIQKNGTTVLSGVITLNNSNTARVAVLATPTVSSYVAGDWFDVVIVATAGGGTLPTGLFVELVADEDPQ